MQGTKNLTEGPIKKQLFNLALPIMGTSFIQMAYSITDMAWVGRLGSEAVAAIGAVGILTWMTTSISYLNKVGSEVSVAQSIGAREEDDARAFASHNLTIALMISVCWGFLLFVLANPIISFFKLDTEISGTAVSYLKIVATGFPFIFLAAACTGIYNAAGLSKIPFYVSGSGLIMNMVLDPLFIFGFGMGTNGAACATWLSEATVLAIFIYYLKKKKRLFGGFPFLIRLKSRYSRRIFQLGLPVARAYHTTLKMTALFGIFCTLLFVFFGSEVFSLIIPEKAAYEAGGVFLRIDGYSMLFMMLEITMQGLFYGTGRTLPPAIISITFNSLRIPMAIGLTAMGLGITGVWWAISISSMLKGIVAFIWFRILQKKIL